MGYCEEDPYCQQTTTTPPWTGWGSMKPLGIALANGSSLAAYEATSARCLSTCGVKVLVMHCDYRD